MADGKEIERLYNELRQAGDNIHVSNMTLNEFIDRVAQDTARYEQVIDIIERAKPQSPYYISTSTVAKWRYYNGPISEAEKRTNRNIARRNRKRKQERERRKRYA